MVRIWGKYENSLIFDKMKVWTLNFYPGKSKILESDTVVFLLYYVIDIHVRKGMSS